MADFKGVVVVTGAGQGLGLSFTKDLSALGYAIVMTDVAEEALCAQADQLRSEGAHVLAIPGSVTNPDHASAAVSAAIEEFGSIDALVNNASIFSSLEMRPFFDIPLDEWRNVVDVNLTGVFIMSRATVDAMRKADKGGRIVNIASAVVPMGRPNYAHYVASKAGVIGLTRAMAREIGEFDITVNSILPGATDTGIDRKTVSPQQREALINARSLKRPQVPEDLTGVLRFLLSEDSRFITGQSLVVDGGTVFL